MVKRRILARPIVLVGMMGSGKSSVGRKLAARLALPFVDSDQEIEQAAGCNISAFFARYGEAEFRAGEKRVIARLLERPMQVIATGGGAFVQPDTRALVQKSGVSVWLKVDTATLIARIGRRSDRPLLQNYADPAIAIASLATEREADYAQAHVTVTSGEQPQDVTVEAVIAALAVYAETQPEQDNNFLVVS